MKIASFGKGSVYKDSRGYLTAAIHMNGRQHLKHVRTVQQAREWILCMETDSTQAASLKYTQLNDAANALDILKSHNLTMTLTELATLWVKDRPLTATQMTLHDALAQYEERSKARVAEKTLHGYMLMLRHFEDDVGDIDLPSFKRADALRYLDRFLTKPPTWKAYHKALSKFFAEALKMEWVTLNPFSNLDAPKVAPPERKFMSVQDAKLALQSVLKRKPSLIHFLTLGLFAGVRPIESLRLTSKHINMATGYIHMTGDITKSHSFKERVVPINDTLKAWFEAYPFEDKPVPANDICNVDKILKDCAAQDHWERTPDNLRHSFATYEFARSCNSAQTAAICGHSEAIACKHYRGRVTPEEAKEYFALLPSRTRA